MASRFTSRVRIIALAAWHSIRTLGRRKAPTNPRRILIAHHLLLGDTLMLTPLLAKLRAQHPTAEIVMTTPKAIAPLYEKRPYGVRAIPYDPRDPGTFQALYPLRGFDLAIVPGDNRHGWLARALGTKWVIAHASDRPAYKNWAVDELVPYPRSQPPGETWLQNWQRGERRPLIARQTGRHPPMPIFRSQRRPIASCTSVPAAH